MFGQAKPRTPEVLSYWHELVENFNISPHDFYTAVEKSLQERKVPGLDVSHVEFAEGGLLSAKREYLRLTRERLVFDICAAPFGTSFFFSCRYAELPLVIAPEAVLAILLVLALIFWLFVHVLGWFLGMLLLLAALMIALYTLRNAVSIGLTDLDVWLIKQPGIGAIYEILFRKDTYYRQDTRVMYLDTVPVVVKRIYEDLTAAQGVKLKPEQERASVQADLSGPKAAAQPAK